MFDVFKKMLRASVGLVIAGLGIYFTMQANIGLAPWDALNQGLADMFGTSFGNVSVATAFIVICIDLLLKEHIGYGTILDAIIVGKAVDFFNYISFIPIQHSLVTSIPLLIAGLFVISFAIYFYMSAGLCCGPRDMLMVAVGKRMRKIPIGYVNMGVLAAVVVVGFFIGAPIGIGTITSVFGLGFTMQIVNNIVKYEPRNTEHEDIIETTKRILRFREDKIGEDF